MEVVVKKVLENVELIKSKFGDDSKELVVKNFTILGKNSAVIYMVGLADTEILTEGVIKPCMLAQSRPTGDFYEFLKREVLFFPDVKNEFDFNKIINELTHGKAIMFVDGQSECLIFSLDKYKERSLTEPPTSAVLKGPREGFVENIKTNTSLIKKIISSPKLKFDYVYIGKYTNTQVAITYIDGICDKELINKVKKRLKKIEIDGIIDSFYVSQFLEEHPYSMFKQIGDTEKPDIVCAKILEGRCAVVVDGSPIVLTLPYMLFEDVQNSDDYYAQHARATFVRILRVFSILITIMLPGLYIAVQLYHYKVMPISFIITIINATQGIPLAPLAELLFVLILFEVLYEASLRMPQYLGIALSIVGALILGDTGVKAGIISSPTVMMVALSGITLYTIPDQAAQLGLLRFLFTLAGGLMGFYGIIVLTVFFVVYLSVFDNYGTSYLAPFAPARKEDFKDAIVKRDLIDMKTRPKSIKNRDKVRMKNERSKH